MKRKAKSILFFLLSTVLFAQETDGLAEGSKRAEPGELVLDF